MLKSRVEHMKQHIKLNGGAQGLPATELVEALDLALQVAEEPAPEPEPAMAGNASGAKAKAKK